MGAVRDDAPWCPDNIEFIRRINGLPDAASGREPDLRGQLPRDGAG
jgi:hypothetical protein